MTNGDYIRSLDDEQLALRNIHLVQIFDQYYSRIKVHGQEYRCSDGYFTSKAFAAFQHVREWLQQPSEWDETLTNSEYLHTASDEQLANCNIFAVQVIDPENSEKLKWKYQVSDGSLADSVVDAYQYELNWLRQPMKEKEE